MGGSASGLPALRAYCRRFKRLGLLRVEAGNEDDELVDHLEEEAMRESVDERAPSGLVDCRESERAHQNRVDRRADLGEELLPQSGPLLFVPAVGP